MITSKLGARARTTIPRTVCAALRLTEGDEIGYFVESGRVIITKARAQPIDDPFGTFNEWSSEVDQRVYADL